MHRSRARRAPGIRFPVVSGDGRGRKAPPLRGRGLGPSSDGSVLGEEGAGDLGGQAALPQQRPGFCPAHGPVDHKNHLLSGLACRDGSGVFARPVVPARQARPRPRSLSRTDPSARIRAEGVHLFSRHDHTRKKPAFLSTGSGLAAGPGWGGPGATGTRLRRRLRRCGGRQPAAGDARSLPRTGLMTAGCAA